MKILVILSAGLAMLAVVAGAFGAHALKATLEAAQRTDTFETAVRYQMWQALGMLLMVLYSSYTHNKIAVTAAWLSVPGVVIFSGALYLICFTGQTKWGAVAPIGGLLIIASWATFIVGIARAKWPF